MGKKENFKLKSQLISKFFIECNCQEGLIGKTYLSKPLRKNKLNPTLSGEEDSLKFNKRITKSKSLLTKKIYKYGDNSGEQLIDQIW